MKTTEQMLMEDAQGSGPVDWLPLHPEWRVVMVRPGDRRSAADFAITSCNGGEALYAAYRTGEPVERVGEVFRYEKVVKPAFGSGDCPFHHYAAVPVEDVALFVQSQVVAREVARREVQHRARLELGELAAKYREAIAAGGGLRGVNEPEVGAPQLREICVFIDEHDFGCLVEFDAESGRLVFLDGEDADRAWEEETFPGDRGDGGLIEDEAEGGKSSHKPEAISSPSPRLEGEETARALLSLRLRIEREEDVKRVVKIVPCGERFRYLIETPFAGFPKFVIGTADRDFADVSTEVRCGLLSTAEDAWERLLAGQPLEFTGVEE